jgi:hypothetical protein
MLLVHFNHLNYFVNGLCLTLLGAYLNSTSTLESVLFEDVLAIVEDSTQIALKRPA